MHLFFSQWIRLLNLIQKLVLTSDCWKQVNWAYFFHLWTIASFRIGVPSILFSDITQVKSRNSCYFLPLFLINKSISKSANLRSLHLQNKSLFNYNSNLYAEGPNICLSCTKNGIFCPSYFVRALVIFVVHILLLNIQSFEWANNRNSLLFFCKCSNKSSIFNIFGKAICGNDVLVDT